MEMFELKYFLAVAQNENVNRAAESIHVSAGSLSKAISRLEEELQIQLFYKSGRGIRLTPEGELLKVKATEIIRLEEDAKIELMGHEAGSFNITIASEEILQTSFGIELARKIRKLFPKARIQFLTENDSDVVKRISDGEIHLAITSAEVPSGLVSKIIAKAEFKTCSGKTHPLAKLKVVPVEKLLEHSFVSPEDFILGRIVKSSTTDGWRDDKFPRKISFKTGSLKMLENLIQDGLALGYLPDYYIKETSLVPLKVTGCSYTCHQTIRLVAKDPSALGWLNTLWSEISE
jgi:DNA-binding transcriptional LysR family regulator